MSRKPISLLTLEGRNKFYNSPEWKAVRYLVLQKNPYCIECLKQEIYTISTEVDHKIDIKDAPELCLDINNLQALCKSCHSKKTYQSTKAVFKKQKFSVVNLKWYNLNIL